MGAAWQGSLEDELVCNLGRMVSNLEEPSKSAGTAQLQTPLCVSAASQQALARSLERFGSMMGSLICTADFVAQAHQAWERALQLLRLPLVLAKMPQMGLLARRTDWAEGVWRPASAANGQYIPALPAYLRRAELPAPMVGHPATGLGLQLPALGLDPLEANSTQAAALVIGQRWPVRELSAENGLWMLEQAVLVPSPQVCHPA